MRIIFGEGPNNVYGIEDILPHRFGPQDLLDDESHPLLLQPQTHNLTLTSGRDKLPKLSLSPHKSLEAKGMQQFFLWSDIPLCGFEPVRWA